MTAETTLREKDAGWARDKRMAEGATSIKSVYMLGIERGIQIERDRATREKIDMTLSKIADISPNGARAI